MQYRKLVIAALVAALPTTAMARLKPVDLADRIDKTGARATITALEAKHKWHRVLAYIGTGKPAWLVVAPRLAAGTDASESLGLTIALADALPRNPAGVLDLARQAKGPLALDRVCAAPYIEPIKSDLVAYRRKAKHAVESIAAPQLHEARRACLRALHAEGDANLA